MIGNLVASFASKIRATLNEYKYIEPEVAGGFGNETMLDTTVHPPVVQNFHFEFRGWMGDDIIETFPCYLVTEKLMNSIIATKLTGIAFVKPTITISNEYYSSIAPSEIPPFYWAQISGILLVNDFVIADDYRLIISEKALSTLESFSINHAIFEEYE